MYKVLDDGVIMLSFLWTFLSFRLRKPSACSLRLSCTKIMLLNPNIFDIHLLYRKSLAPLPTTKASWLLQDEPQYSVYLSDLYTKPWCRIGAYLAGMITGYVIHNYNNKIRMLKVRGALPKKISLSWVVEILHGRQVALATPKVGPQSSGQ